MSRASLIQKWDLGGEGPWDQVDDVLDDLESGDFDGLSVRLDPDNPDWGQARLPFARSSQKPRGKTIFAHVGMHVTDMKKLQGELGRRMYGTSRRSFMEQVRSDTIEEYARRFREGERPGPFIIEFEPDGSLNERQQEGRHRVQAAKKSGIKWVHTLSLWNAPIVQAVPGRSRRGLLQQVRPMTHEQVYVVAWHPDVERWRVYRVPTRGVPKAKMDLEKGTRRESIEAIARVLTDEDYGIVVRSKSGDGYSLRHRNVKVIAEELRGFGKIFGKRSLVVWKSAGQWKISSSGPTSGYNLPIRTPMETYQSKNIARKSAKGKLKQNPGKYIGAIGFGNSDAASWFDADIESWNEFVQTQLQKVPEGQLVTGP